MNGGTKTAEKGGRKEEGREGGIEKCSTYQEGGGSQTHSLSSPDLPMDDEAASEGGGRRRLTTSPKRARERKKAMTSAAASRSRFSPEINILHFSVRSSPPPSSLVPFSSQFSPNGSTKCHQIRGEGERGGRGKRWSLCALPPSLFWPP